MLQPQTDGSTVIYYKVKPGDTLWRISQKYKGISVQKLMQINGIKRAGDLKAGDTIKIVLDVG
jgi:membrane-bound lytic murein transglycosylase D